MAFSFFSLDISQLSFMKQQKQFLFFKIPTVVLKSQEAMIGSKERRQVFIGGKVSTPAIKGRARRGGSGLLGLPWKVLQTGVGGGFNDSRGWKSEIKVPAGLVSPAASLLGSQMGAFPLCLHVDLSLCVSVSSFPLLIRTQS